MPKAHLECLLSWCGSAEPRVAASDPDSSVAPVACFFRDSPCLGVHRSDEILYLVEKPSDLTVPDCRPLLLFCSKPECATFST